LWFIAEEDKACSSREAQLLQQPMTTIEAVRARKSDLTKRGGIRLVSCKNKENMASELQQGPGQLNAGELQRGPAQKN